tara:strand:- start:902 stop:1753 length:852 start_codon:yes stop_codon:yes gene_type:complete
MSQEDTAQDNAGHNKDAVELARKLLGKWSGEETVEEVQQKADALARKDEDKVSLEIKQFPAITFLEGRLPRTMLDELNTHVDEHREKLEDFSQNLVGQIKQTEKSQQLSLDVKEPVVQGLVNLMSSAGRTFLKSYANQIPLDGGENMFDEAPVNCMSIWTVHSYEGDYNPLHDHDVSYDTKCMAFSIILYCKVPPQISYEGRGNKVHSNGGATDGCTYFTWGTNTGADHLILKPKTEQFVIPEEGKFLIFPSWLKHSVGPFYGEGERRTLSANFRVPFGSNEK